MNQSVTTHAQPVLDAISRSGQDGTAIVVVIGSAARGVMNGRSDIDILILQDDEDCRISLNRSGRVHLQQESRSRFLRRLEAGDDYPGWGLRFGIPIRDPDGWWAKHAAAEHEAPHWPNWRPKVDQARGRLNMALDLLAVGDVEAASEELMFAVTHVARAILLKEGVFPLSRPELPAQLRDSEPDIARLLEDLISGDPTVSSLMSGQKLLEYYIERIAPSPTLA